MEKRAKDENWQLIAVKRLVWRVPALYTSHLLLIFITSLIRCD